MKGTFFRDQNDLNQAAREAGKKQAIANLEAELRGALVAAENMASQGDYHFEDSIRKAQTAAWNLREAKGQPHEGSVYDFGEYGTCDNALNAFRAYQRENGVRGLGGLLDGATCMTNLKSAKSSSVSGAAA